MKQATDEMVVVVMTASEGCGISSHHGDQGHVDLMRCIVNACLCGILHTCVCYMGTGYTVGP